MFGMPNQYVKPIYKHQLFAKVMSTHNTVKIRTKEFKINEEFLLIDLDGHRDRNLPNVISPRDRKTKPETLNGRMSMIKLYQEHHMLKWGLKLVKYQVSFSKKKVFFAFQALNT
jgi:hypothetical protein